jgi:tetratricopeptide (TPR) repeat protein
MGNNPDSLDELTEKAEELEDLGQITEAIEAWRYALNKYTTPYLLYRFGKLAMDLGRLTEAEQSLLLAIQSAKEFPAPYVSLGILYLNQGKYEKAIEHLKRVLLLEKNASTYNLLGVAQNRLGITDQARINYNKAIKSDPAYEEAYYNLATTYRYEDHEKAISLFRKSLELDSEYSIAHRELGWLFNRLGRLSEAEYHLRKAIEFDDSDGWAYGYLGNTLWKQKKNSAAEQMFLKAIEVYPEDNFTYWCLAMFYEYNERADEADFFYEKAVQLDPEDPQTNLRFGLFLKDIGETKKAKDHLNRVLISDPHDIQARLALAELEEVDETESQQQPN